MQDVDMESPPPKEIEPAHPAVGGLYPVIDEVRDVAIRAIDEAKKESTELSYRMLIAGAIFGFLGSFFGATILRWYDVRWSFEGDEFLLAIIGGVAFVGSIYLVAKQLGKVKKS